MILWIVGIINGVDFFSYLIFFYFLWFFRFILYLLKGEELILYDLFIIGKICCKSEVCYVMLFYVMLYCEESYVGRMKLVLFCFFC